VASSYHQVTMTSCWKIPPNKFSWQFFCIGGCYENSSKIDRYRLWL